MVSTGCWNRFRPAAAAPTLGPWSLPAKQNAPKAWAHLTTIVSGQPVSPARSPSAAAGSGSSGRGSAAPTASTAAPASPGRRSPPASCSTSWPRSECWSSSRPAAIRSTLSRRRHGAAGRDRTSKSAVVRRFVAATEHALAELLAQDLSGLEPGRAHSRWHLGRRAHLCGRPRHHPGRHKGPPSVWPRAPPRTPPSYATCWPTSATRLSPLTTNPASSGPPEATRIVSAHSVLVVT
jgi:hypothetical protein